MIEHLTSTYSGQDATYEIIIMLSVAFLLGFIFRLSLGQLKMAKLKSQIHALKRNQADLKRINDAMGHRLAYFQKEKAEQPREVMRDDTYQAQELIGSLPQEV